MMLRHIPYIVTICVCIFATSAQTLAKDTSSETTTEQVEGAPPIKRGQLKGSGAKEPASEDERMEYKRELAKELVHQAAKFFKANSIGYACRKFAEDESWQFDEMYAFVIHESGVIYVHGKDNDLIWRNINEAQKERTLKSPVDLQENIVDRMRETARTGDGWLNYEWNFENKHVYVQEVEKDGRIYYVGTGFYPETHRYLVKQMVQRAINYTKKYDPSEAFQRMNNPVGAFVQGPVYLWAYDFDGMCHANGRDYGMVGRTHMDWQGEQGRYLIRDIVQYLQDHEHGWFDYYAQGNVLKRVYAERFTDPKDGKRYFIGGGYYPQVDLAAVKNFVRDAIDYLQSQGPKVAFREFTGKTGGFHKGPMRIFVYDMKGTILADGQNPGLLGENILDVASKEGRPIFEEILRKAREYGEGKTTAISFGEYKDVYYKKIEVPSGEYIVGSGYWPDSKRTVVESLAQKATMEMEQASIEEALRKFTTWSFDYVRGDLFVEVLDFDGIIVAYGPRNAYMWEKVDVETETGDTVADILISTAQAGGGWTSYRSQGRRYHMYVNQVSKEISTRDGPRMKNYVVGVFYI